MNQRFGFLLIIVLVSFVLFTGCSRVQTIDTGGVKEFTFNSDDLASDSAGIVRDIQAGKDVIIKVPAGQTLPFQMKIDLPMLQTMGDPGKIKFTRDIYFFISQKRMLISPDGTSWALIQDWDAIKKLYGISKGSLSFGLSASKKHKTRLEMVLKAE